MKARLELEGSTELREELLAADRRVKSSRKSVLDRIADRFVSSIKARLQAGLSPPLTETSIRLRGGGSTPLVGGTGPIGKHSTGVGTILGSVRAFAGETEAAAVVDNFVARFHQFGFTTSPDSAIPERQVPARPFVLISDADADWALEQLADELLIGGAGA